MLLFVICSHVLKTNRSRRSRGRYLSTANGSGLVYIARCARIPELGVSRTFRTFLWWAEPGRDTQSTSPTFIHVIVDFSTPPPSPPPQSAQCIAHGLFLFLVKFPSGTFTLHFICIHGFSSRGARRNILCGLTNRHTPSRLGRLCGSLPPPQCAD